MSCPSQRSGLQHPALSNQPVELATEARSTFDLQRRLALDVRRQEPPALAVAFLNFAGPLTCELGDPEPAGDLGNLVVELSCAGGSRIGVAQQLRTR